jgi:hypothetical protein
MEASHWFLHLFFGQNLHCVLEYNLSSSEGVEYDALVDWMKKGKTRYMVLSRLPSHT